MINIYQTDQMELAVREMSLRNHAFVVYCTQKNRRKIPLRLNEVKDIPMVIAREWDPFFQKSIDFWKDEGGMLLYRHGPVDPKPVEAEAALFTEAPLSYMEFEILSSHIQREMVIYRPPTWNLHEDMLEYKNPTSNIYYTLYTLIHCLMGRELPPRLEAALQYSEYRARDKVAVFEAKEIQAIIGLDDRQIRTVLNGKGLHNVYSRYHCYTPMIEPEDPDLLYFYKLLESCPAMPNNERYLRMDLFPGHKRLQGQSRLMSRLVREKYVKKNPHIYVIRTGYKPLDYPVIDAIANARRGEWFRMRNLIDQSPEYPLIQCLEGETQSEPFEFEPT